MLKIILAVAVIAAGFIAAAPASARRLHFYHGHKNDTQTVKRGGRGGAHHGQRYGRTSY